MKTKSVWKFIGLKKKHTQPENGAYGAVIYTNEHTTPDTNLNNKSVSGNLKVSLFPQDKTKPFEVNMA